MLTSNLRVFFKTFFCGMCMGAADIVPGISGGTMAMICGIYEKLISSIKNLGGPLISALVSFDKKKINDLVSLNFFAPLILGVVISFTLFSQIIHDILQDPEKRTYLYMFFYGMITSSLIVLSLSVSKWTKRMAFGVVTGFFTIFILSGYLSQAPIRNGDYQVILNVNDYININKKYLNYDVKSHTLFNLNKKTLAAMWAKGYLNGSSEVTNTKTRQKSALEDLVEKEMDKRVYPWLIFCGAVAVSAMLLPGISGSFLLMILGAYPEIIQALAEFTSSGVSLKFHEEAFLVLANVFFGICIGAVLFSKVIDWLLKKDHNLTMAVLIGFVGGSLKVISPFWNYSWQLNPLKMTNPTELIPLKAIRASVFDSGFWKTIPFFIFGFFLIYLINQFSKYSKQN